MAGVRRDKGDGSIRKRTNKSYEGRYTFEDAFGEKQTEYVYAKTQTECKTKLKELIKQIERNEYVPPNDILVGEWLDTWMQDYVKNSVRPSTYATYSHSIEKHIRPKLGNIELMKLRPEHIQRLMNDMGKETPEGKALNPWTITKAKNIMSGALKQAIRNRILQYNPMTAVVPPKTEQKDIRILTEAEQQQFMGALKGHRLEAFFTLALATGMRRGELIALNWDNVNLKSQEISVNASVVRYKDPETGKTALVSTQPKTKSGMRTVPLLDSMVTVLQDHKQRQEKEQEKAGSAWNPQNLVFCSNVGTYLEPRRINTTMDKIINASGVERVTFHALRHTFATRMLERNVSPKVVQEILGHSDVTLTLNTYSHVIGSTAHEQIAKIGDIFSNDKAAPPPPQKKKRTPQKGKKKSEPER